MKMNNGSEVKVTLRELCELNPICDPEKAYEEWLNIKRLLQLRKRIQDRVFSR